MHDYTEPWLYVQPVYASQSDAVERPNHLRPDTPNVNNLNNNLSHQQYRIMNLPQTGLYGSMTYSRTFMPPAQPYPQRSGMSVPTRASLCPEKVDSLHGADSNIMVYPHPLEDRVKQELQAPPAWPISASTSPLLQEPVTSRPLEQVDLPVRPKRSTRVKSDGRGGVDADGFKLPMKKASDRQSWAVRIRSFLLKCKDYTATLKEIYAYMSSQQYPEVVTQGKGMWQNSIRHNLSLNGGFIRVQPSSSHSWRLSEKALKEDVLPSTRFRKDKNLPSSRGTKRKRREDDHDNNPITWRSPNTSGGPVTRGKRRQRQEESHRQQRTSPLASPAVLSPFTQSAPTPNNTNGERDGSVQPHSTLCAPLPAEAESRITTAITQPPFAESDSGFTTAPASSPPAPYPNLPRFSALTTEPTPPFSQSPSSPRQPRNLSQPLPPTFHPSFHLPTLLATEPEPEPDPEPEPFLPTLISSPTILTPALTAPGPGPGLCLPPSSHELLDLNTFFLDDGNDDIYHYEQDPDLLLLPPPHSHPPTHQWWEGLDLGFPAQGSLFQHEPPQQQQLARPFQPDDAGVAPMRIWGETPGVEMEGRTQERGQAQEEEVEVEMGEFVDLDGIEG